MHISAFLESILEDVRGSPSQAVSTMSGAIARFGSEFGSPLDGETIQHYMGRAYEIEGRIKNPFAPEPTPKPEPQPERETFSKTLEIDGKELTVKWRDL